MKKTNPVILLTAVSVVVLGGTIGFYLLYQVTAARTFQVLSITFLTTLYHLTMRLAVGESVTLACRGRKFNYDAPWFRPKKWEAGLYRRLGVKKWKKNVITAKPVQFDPKRQTPEQLVFYMTQAEIVHEIIMVFSWVPLLFIIPFDAPWAFILTSALACLCDGVFVIIQRYNRPRVLRLIQRRGK